MGMTSGKLIGSTVADVPSEEAGSASGVVNTVLQLGTAAGIALVGTVFFGRIRAKTLPADAVQIALLTELGLLVAALIATIGLPKKNRTGVTRSLRAQHLGPDTAAGTGTPTAPE